MRKVLILIFFTFIFAFSMNLIKVEENLYMVRGHDGLPSKENRGFISNAFGVLTEKGWVVVDSLTNPSLAREFIGELKKVSKKPILYLIVTHYHLDHWYGAKAFKEEGAKIVGHIKLKEVYDSGEAHQVLEAQKKIFKEVLKDVKLVPPDITVKDKKVLKVGGEEFVVYAMSPAHTNTDLVILWRNKNILFAGDLVYKDRIPFMGDRNASSKGWLEALERIKEMKPRLILGGHNYPLDLSAVDWTYNYIKFVRDKVKKLKDEGYFIDEVIESFKGNPYEKVKMYDVFHRQNVWKVYNELDLEL
ncbi:MBL fold metallo-hydrolase [Aquifex pyrophilus]